MAKSKEAIPQIELRGIRKAFGACVALDDVSFSVRPGSIHAVVGENGAGKSTAMKVLFGQYRADRGEILIDGHAVQWRSSADAVNAGIGMVHQHFMLAGSHNAVENVLLAAGGREGAWLDHRAARSRLTALMREFGMEVRLDLPVKKLSVGEQQRVEILKLLYCNSRILILDEPTAVLAPGEIEALFATLRGMAAGGKTVLIITHKLKEVLALAERVTVFRAGRVTGERAVAGATVGELARMMIGREVKLEPEGARPPARPEPSLELLDARPDKTLARLGPVSFRLHAGEILGVAGVEGNGQSELIQMLLNPRAHLREGEMRLHGVNVSRWSGAKLRRESSFGVLPEDRLRQALLLEATVEDNFLLGRQQDAHFRHWGLFVNRPVLRESVQAAMEHFDVRPRNSLAHAGSLSGGNQQKLVVARELSRDPRFLLAAQPTRGVDVGAIEFIHAQLLELRRRGSGILLISSELDEVLKLSDRLLVMYRGRVVGAFLRAEFDEARIGMLMAAGALDRSTA